MALCYLPQEHIQPSFQRLKEGIDPEQSPKLMNLTKYIENTWITSSVWPVNSSVFMRPTRTNNDVEGWHHHLNKDKKAGSGNKGLYSIAPLLIEEANLLPIQIQLVSKGKLKKLQRRHVRKTQRLLFNQWEQYIEGSISVSRLLRLCGRLVYIRDQ
jgi:hypothetical protein